MPSKHVPSSRTIKHAVLFDTFFKYFLLAFISNDYVAAIRAMAAAALATLAAPQMISRGEDHRGAFPVKIFALDERLLLEHFRL